MLDATEDMFTIVPCLRASIPGSAARMVRTIDSTLRSQAAAKLASSLSSTVPFGTMPAQLKRMSQRSSRAKKAETASSSRTSRRVARMLGSPSAFSAASSMSVAWTVAPSAAKACAVARPIPAPAAVTTAIFPESLKRNSPTALAAARDEEVGDPEAQFLATIVDRDLGCLLEEVHADEDRRAVRQAPDAENRQVGDD